MQSVFHMDDLLPANIMQLMLQPYHLWKQSKSLIEPSFLKTMVLKYLRLAFIRSPYHKHPTVLDSFLSLFFLIAQRNQAINKYKIPRFSWSGALMCCLCPVRKNIPDHPPSQDSLCHTQFSYIGVNNEDDSHM